MTAAATATATSSPSPPATSPGETHTVPLATLRHRLASSSVSRPQKQPRSQPHLPSSPPGRASAKRHSFALPSLPSYVFTRGIPPPQLFNVHPALVDGETGQGSGSRCQPALNADSLPRRKSSLSSASSSASGDSGSSTSATSASGHNSPASHPHPHHRRPPPPSSVKRLPSGNMATTQQHRRNISTVSPASTPSSRLPQPTSVSTSTVSPSSRQRVLSLNETRSSRERAGMHSIRARTFSSSAEETKTWPRSGIRPPASGPRRSSAASSTAGTPRIVSNPISNSFQKSTPQLKRFGQASTTPTPAQPASAQVSQSNHISSPSSRVKQARDMQTMDVGAVRSPPPLQIGACGKRWPSPSHGDATPRAGSAQEMVQQSMQGPQRGELRAKLVGLLTRLVGGEDQVRIWGVDPQTLLMPLDEDWPTSGIPSDAPVVDVKGDEDEGRTRGHMVGGENSRESALWFATGLRGTEGEEDQSDFEVDRMKMSRLVTVKPSHSQNGNANKLRRKSLSIPPALSHSGTTGSGGGLLGRFGWKNRNARANKKLSAAQTTGSLKEKQAAKETTWAKEKEKTIGREKDQRKVSGGSANEGRVFGVPLGRMSRYASCVTIIGGQRHILPILVFSAVEDIYRRGMTTPGLFRIAGDLTRIDCLVQIFDNPPTYGERQDVSTEDVHTLFSLLKRYLRALPEPLLDSRLAPVYWHACVEPALGLSASAANGMLGVDESISARRRIAAAQCILRLLPMQAFSLLVYVAAFLSQIPLFPENELSLDSLSKILGPALLGPRNVGLPGLGSNGAHGGRGSASVDGARFEAERASQGLLWLLRNWNEVTEGLLEETFDVDVDVLLAQTPIQAQQRTMTYPYVHPTQGEIGSAGSLDDGDEEKGAEVVGGEQQREIAEKEYESTLQTPMHDRLDSVIDAYGQMTSSTTAPGEAMPFSADAMQALHTVGGQQNLPSDHAVRPIITPVHPMSPVAPQQEQTSRALPHITSSVNTVGPPAADVAPSSTPAGHDSRGRTTSSATDAHARGIVDRYESSGLSVSESGSPTLAKEAVPYVAVATHGSVGKPRPQSLSSMFPRSPILLDTLTSPTDILGILSDLIRSRDQIIQGQACRISETDEHYAKSLHKIAAYEAELQENQAHIEAISRYSEDLRTEVNELLSRLAEKEDETHQLREAMEQEKVKAQRALEFEREAAVLKIRLADEERQAQEQQGALLLQLEQTKTERDELIEKVSAVKQALGVLQAEEVRLC